MSLIKEFKEFAMRGNVMDMAVGVIMGGAFGKIVGSLVNDVLMPPLGYAIGGVEFKALKKTLPPLEAKEFDTATAQFVNVMEKNAAGEMVKKMVKVDILYGSFIQSVVDFMIIAIAIFAMIKIMNYMMKKREEAPAAAAPAETPADVKLLAEIRDLLKANK